MLTGRKRILSQNNLQVKGILILSGLILTLYSAGQSNNLTDTVNIGEVIVKGSNFISAPGNKVSIIDSSLLKEYSHNNISDVISENAPIFIKSYGSGGIATISLRGTGAGYTQLAWNGVNINSPMLGQTDLSLLPAGFVDDINIYYGGSSLSLNSGGIGGIINMETKPQWRKETTLLADIGAGSNGRYSGLIKVRTGNKTFQSTTKVLYQSAKNDFVYLNTVNPNDPVRERRKNAAVLQNSFMQELYYHRNKSVVSARFWYLNADRDIPVPIVNQQPVNGESQVDESFRSMLNFSGYSGKSDYNSSISWFSDKLNYKNPLLSINSRNLANTIILKSGVERNINARTRLMFIVNDELSIVNSVNYNGIKSRNLAGMTLSLTRKFGDKLNYTALVKETIKDKNFMIPDFTTGIDYRLTTGKDYFIKANVSHNSRIPTLNDMYWNPGGNPHLKNEYSFTGELTYEMIERISSTLNINSQLSFYLISIDNMVKWTPVNSGYWSPFNIEKAKSLGLEGNVSLNYENNFWRVRVNAKYAWNKAQVVASSDGEEISGKQLVYVPENMFNTNLKATYKNYYVSWISSFTGKQFTTTDNTKYIPGYYLQNVMAGINLSLGKNGFELNLKVENLTDVSYQTIAWYPMPGRTFLISIIYKLGI
jgi:outer membrane cobalamin receptor